MTTYLVNSIPNLIFQLHTYGFTDKTNGIFLSYNRELHLYIATTRSFLKKLLTFLFLDINLHCKIFTDLACIDYPTKINRFHVIYNILSINYHIRAFINVWVNEVDKIISVVDIYPAASWFEREVWDLFGVHFYGNPDLRRILTDYGFFGHPFRKDFPLSGFEEINYDVRLNSIVYLPITLVQEFRIFDTISSWDKINS